MEEKKEAENPRADGRKILAWQAFFSNKPLVITIGVSVALLAIMLVGMWLVSLNNQSPGASSGNDLLRGMRGLTGESGPGGEMGGGFPPGEMEGNPPVDMGGGFPPAGAPTRSAPGN